MTKATVHDSSNLLHPCVEHTRLRAGSRARWHCKVLNGRATLRSDTWSRSVQERRNALKRVSNATGMSLTGDARLILTSETFRFCGGAADTWWLLSLLFLYSLLLHTSVLQRFWILLLSFCHLYGSFLIQDSNYAGLFPTCCVVQPVRHRKRWLLSTKIKKKTTTAKHVPVTGVMAVFA